MRLNAHVMNRTTFVRETEVRLSVIVLILHNTIYIPLFPNVEVKISIPTPRICL